MNSLFKRVETYIMLALGFSAGLPILLVYSTLSTWLREASVDIKAIGWFSLVGLAYGFKFLWAPLIDRLPCPILSNHFGHRRGWLLASQLLLLISLFMMGNLDPAPNNIDSHIATAFIYGALFIAIASATQDIVIDAIRVELAEPELQAWLSGVYIAGYRIGMIVAGAGALYLAGYFGSTAKDYSLIAWQNTYWCMALFVPIGMLTALASPEPPYNQAPQKHPTRDYLRLILLFSVCLSVFFIAYIHIFNVFTERLQSLLISDMSSQFTSAIIGFICGSIRFLCAIALALLIGWCLSKLRTAPRQLITDTFISPFTDLITRFGQSTLLILLVIASYRLTDVVMGVLANPFYIDTGFSKDQIATVTKVFGLIITIFGGFFGGWLTKQKGIFTGLFIGASLSAATNLVFSWLANIGPELYGLYFAIGIDNLAGGMAAAAFVAFLSALTNREFTATQYATLFAITAIFPKLVAAKSGEWVEQLGYSQFFIMTAILGIPALVFLYLLKNKVPKLFQSSSI